MTLIRQLIKQIPGAVPMYEKYIALVRARAGRGVLKQLGRSPHPRGAQIAEALNALQRTLPPSDQDWVQKIEGERAHLLSRTEPLVDGSLGEGGLYDEGVTVQQACLVSKPLKPAILLFLLTRATKPLNVIELGTNVGISSAYIAAALKLNGPKGRVVTLDASPYRQQLAREIHGRLALDPVSYVAGLFADTLKPSLKELGSVDLAFIDGHHQYQPTIDYFEEILKFSTPETVFVFDDIRWSDGMKMAWAQLQADDRLGLVVDLSSVGICAGRQPGGHPRFVCTPSLGLTS